MKKMIVSAMLAGTFLFGTVYAQTATPATKPAQKTEAKPAQKMETAKSDTSKVKKASVKKGKKAPVKKADAAAPAMK